MGENGGGIYLGLFTDDTCSQFADEYGGRETYVTLSYGKSLPYSESTMIGSECMSCKEPQDADENNDNDQEDEDEVKESCEQLYEGAGKCEYGLDIQYPNNYGCNFMEGIKIVRKNGAIVQGAGASNTTASVFIGLFAASFVLLGGYAYYLKTKLDRAFTMVVVDKPVQVRWGPCTVTAKGSPGSLTVLVVVVQGTVNNVLLGQVVKHDSPLLPEACFKDCYS